MNSGRQTPVNCRCCTVSAFVGFVSKTNEKWTISIVLCRVPKQNARSVGMVSERTPVLFWLGSSRPRFKEPRARCLLEDRVSEGKRKSEREAWAYPGQERIAEGLALFLSQFFSLPFFPFISLSHKLWEEGGVTKVSQSFEVTGVQMHAHAQC